MPPRRILRRRRATTDILDAAIFYRVSATERVALNFSEALEDAIGFIVDHPLAGTLRYAEMLDYSGLRAWALRKFPYIVFYVVYDESIEILRVLHAHRDLAGLLGDWSEQPRDL